MLNDDAVSPLKAARAVLAALERGPALAVVTALEGPAAGRRLLLDATGRRRGSLGDPALDDAAIAHARRALGTGAAATVTVHLPVGEVRLFAEAYRPPDDLLVVGAGHVAVPLAELGVRLGFRVTVLDDREEFATPERFPDAARVLRTDFADPFREVEIGPNTHVVLVTRAHKYDFDCLRRLVALDVPPAYVGMIGSRRRVRAAFQALLDAGVPRERLASVRAPVGLDIGAETPEEIAVSVAAELILLRRRGADACEAAVLSGAERVLDRLLPEPATDHG